LAKPVINSPNANSIELYWEADNIYAMVTRLKEHGDGRITAEVALKVNKPDIPAFILRNQINLLSARSQKEIAKEAERVYYLSDGQWEGMIKQLCEASLENYRRGVPVKEIWPFGANDKIPPAEFLISPLLYKDKPTILFGEQGTTKSYLALTLALVAQLPYYDNPLWLAPKQANALYLDYEGDELEFKRRLTLLTRGFGLPQTPIIYRECHLPLIDDINYLEQTIVEYRIGFIIIDSLGVAVGKSSLNDPVTATAFFADLRRLKVTSLIITHLAKDKLTKYTSPFGSVYFGNLARSVFEVKKQQEENKGEIATSLIHKKNNQGPLLSPQGFKLVFEEDKTLVKRIDPSTVPEFLEGQSLKFQIAELLKKGSLPVKDLAENLGKSEDTIRKTLKRNESHFVQLNDGWGLVF